MVIGLSNKALGVIFLILSVINALVAVVIGDIYLLVMHSILGALAFIIGISFLDNSRDDW